MQLTLDNAASSAAEFLATVESYPAERFSGRGIVTCAGGVQYGTCAWVLVRMLRELGCTLPVEMWYLGDDEGDPQLVELLSAYDVTCIDARSLLSQYPHPRLGGWQSKAYAILHSRFEEILFLDADNVPVVDPTFLFDSPEYRKHGAIFWPDGPRMTPDRPAWRAFDVPYRNEREVESGQLLIDKRRAWPAMPLCDWYNQHSDFFYQHIYGDKDTFRFAWHRTGHAYFMPCDCALLPYTICQHDAQGRRLFQHRCHAKWSMYSKKRLHGFIHEERCHAFVEELRALWQPQWHLMRRATEVDRREMERCSEFDYRLIQVGRNHWPARLGNDGVLERGVTDAYRFWWLEQDRLRFAGNQGRVTCTLARNGAGWQGKRRIENSQVPIRLEPLAT